MFLDKQFINYELRFHKLRRTILYTITAIFFIGLLFVYAASSIYSWFNFQDSIYFFKRQVLFGVLGFFSLLGILRLNIDYLKRHSKVLLIFGISLLFLVLIFGLRISGAKRWFKFLGFGFQPSEFMKIIFLIYLADYFSRKKNLANDFLKGILPVLVVTGIISFLIFLEPDFGNAIFFGLILIVFLFISRVSKKYLAYLLLFFLIIFTFLIFSSPYRRARVFSYFNPWSDPQGAGFQLVQSQIGLGSGGLLGVGIGESKQKLFFLPAAHTDFIFSIIGEEIGFLGSCLVLSLYIFIFFQGLRILRWVKDDFNFYLGWGALFIIILQALINISVVVGIFPTKGLPLPFISYGGSSVLVSFILLGLFFNATKQA